jgi:3-methylcrotonyl-CoA carboxylase alpha subunit
VRVLVWNRGEIAVRACLAAARLGLRSVLFLPPPDEDGPAVRLADEIHPWPESDPARGFLSLDAVARAVRDTRADLVYPGYGFLAESAALAETVAAAGARLVGPPASALRLVAHKGRARELARRCGLADLGVALDRPAFPLLLKAVAGGGGRGNVLVEHPAELEPALAALRRRARELFGDDEIIAERYLPSARHVEVQIFGCAGGVRVLGSRDCSLQRRHQKVVEEGPAPAAAAALLAPHLEALERELSRIGYRGAGTVELLWDRAAGRLFFLEINPRIQVEHPVTELLLGEDLVEWQLREAAGERLVDRPLGTRGHAVEARLVAEDPARGFLPESGVVHRLSLPAPPFCRWDLGVEEGGRVTRHYDPMIGKLVAWGRDRNEALARAGQALRAASVHGVVTNLDFLMALLAHPTVVRDEHDTRFIERELSPAAPPAPPVTGLARLFAPPAPPTASSWKRGHRR